MALKSLPRYCYLIGTCRCPSGSSIKIHSRRRYSHSPFLKHSSLPDSVIKNYRLETTPTEKTMTSLNQPVSNENTFALNVLRNHKDFAETLSKVFKPQTATTDINLDDVAQMTCSCKLYELIQQFEQFSDQRKPEDCLLSNEVFTPLTEALISNIPAMNDDELLSILRHLAKWPLEEKSGNFYTLWKALDQECLQRIRLWSREKVLLVVLHWFFLQLMRKSDFVRVGLKKVGRKPQSLSPSQLVQFMFFANVARCFHPAVDMLDVEWALYNNFNQFTIHDLGIVSLGFFKSETMIREPKLINALIISLVNNLDVAHSLTVAAILKTVRLSVRHWSLDHVEKLLTKLVEHVDKYSIMVCCHICFLITKTAVKNDELLEKIAQKLRNHIKTARIKDISTIVGCLLMCNYKCSENPNIFELSLSEFRDPDRQSEIMEHPKQLIPFMSKLTILQMYPEDLLSKLFSKEFLVHAYGKKINRFTLPVQFLQLHFATKLEAPSYQGPLLDPELVQSMSNHVGWYIPRATDKQNAYRMIYEAACIVGKCLGDEEFAKIMYAFPSSLKPDIIFCLDEKTNKPLPIPEDVKAVSLLEATLPSTRGKWHCIFGLGEYGVLYKTQEPVGHLIRQSRLLSKIGYEPHFWHVNVGHWHDFSEQEKENTVKRILNFSQLGQSSEESSK